MLTRCPACQTVFRLRPEQLHARGGEVRCGHCFHPFNALENTVEVRDDGGASAPPPPKRYCWNRCDSIRSAAFMNMIGSSERVSSLTST